jgi:diacylglycerol O-acyltransferase
MLAAFLDLGPRPRDVDPPEDTWEAERLPSAPSLVRRALGAVVQEPGLVVGTVNRSIRTVAELVDHRRRVVSGGSVAAPAPFAAPRTSLNGAVSTRRSFAMASLSLAEVKLVGKTFGATVNDVVLATVGGALRSLLELRGEELEESLIAMVPVSTRERVKGSEAKVAEPTLGNKVSAMLVSLASTIEDPVERLIAVSESGIAAKSRNELLGGRVIDDLAQLIVPALSTRAARLLSNLRIFDRIAPVFNVTVSNVPGPQFDLWFGGCRIDGLYPMGPVVEGVGLNITALSYMGEIHFGMLGCRRLVRDMDAMPSLLRYTFEELLGNVPVTVDAAG